MSEEAVTSIATADEGGRTATARWRSLTRDVLTTYGLAVLLVVAVVVFSILPASGSTFATLTNLRNILSNVSVSTVVALAAIGPLISGEFDFSIGLTMEASSIAFAASLTRLHAPLILAVAITLLIAGTIGSINGFLVSRLKLNSFITTFAMATIVTGLITFYVQGLSILVDDSTLNAIGGASSLTLGIPRIAFVVTAIALAAAYVLNQTAWGRQLQAVGSNRVAARLVGLRVERKVFSAFVGSATLAGVAGMLYVAQQGAASPNVGGNYVLPAFAAVFLGSTAFRPGRFNVPGTVVAQLFVVVGSTGLILSGLDPWVQYVFQGGVLILALAATRARRARRP